MSRELAAAAARLGGGRSGAKGPRPGKGPQLFAPRPAARTDLCIPADGVQQFLDKLLQESGVPLGRMGVENFWENEA